jgi:hypothetical protein
MDDILALSTVAATAVAIIALVLSWRLGKQQRVLQAKQVAQQEQQLKQDLFDKRFAVYYTVDEFLRKLMVAHGNFDNGDYAVFIAALDRAEFLFDVEANDYLHEIRGKVKAAKAIAQEAVHVSALGQSYYQVTEEILKILSDLDDPDKRKVLFAPYLQLQRLDRA